MTGALSELTSGPHKDLSWLSQLTAEMEGVRKALVPHRRSSFIDLSTTSRHRITPTPSLHAGNKAVAADALPLPAHPSSKPIAPLCLNFSNDEQAKLMASMHGVLEVIADLRRSTPWLRSAVTPPWDGATPSHSTPPRPPKPSTNTGTTNPTKPTPAPATPSKSAKITTTRKPLPPSSFHPYGAGSNHIPSSKDPTTPTSKGPTIPKKTSGMRRHSDTGPSHGAKAYPTSSSTPVRTASNPNKTPRQATGRDRRATPSPQRGTSRKPKPSPSSASRPAKEPSGSAIPSASRQPIREMMKRKKNQKVETEVNHEIFVASKPSQRRQSPVAPSAFQFHGYVTGQGEGESRSGGAVATSGRAQRSMSAPAPPTTSGSGHAEVEALVDKTFFRTTGKTTVRIGPGSSEEEAGVLEPGTIVMASSRHGDWIKLASGGAGQESVAGGRGGEGEESIGYWILKRNKHRAMLEELGEEEAELHAPRWKGVGELLATGNPLAHSTSPLQARLASPPPAPSPDKAQAGPSAPHTNQDSDKDYSFPYAVKTVVRCTVRAEPRGTAEMVHDVPEGTVLKALAVAGEWVRVASLPGYSVPTAPGRAASPQEFWILARKRHRSMLARAGDADWQVSEAEAASQWPDNPELQAATRPATDGQPQWFQVVGPRALTVREGATGSATAVGLLPTGQVAAVLEVAGHWLHVVVYRSFGEVEVEGWVLGHVAASGVDLMSEVQDEARAEALTAEFIGEVDKGSTEGAVEAVEERDREEDKGTQVDQEEVMAAGGGEVVLGGEPNEGGDQAMEARRSPVEDAGATAGVARVLDQTDFKTEVYASAEAQWPQFMVVPTTTGPLHIHDQPGVGGQIIAEIPVGHLIKALGVTSSHWLQVCLLGPSGEKVIGYLHSRTERDLLRVVSDGFLNAERTWCEQQQYAR